MKKVLKNLIFQGKIIWIGKYIKIKGKKNNLSRRNWAEERRTKQAELIKKLGRKKYSKKCFSGTWKAVKG